MLAIRMQRTGRKGHANFRVIVQDSHLSPTSGKFVAHLGSYDPHTKVSTLVKEKAAFYLEHGARPSDRVAQLLKKEGVKLPEWVEVSGKKSHAIRHTDKLRRNRPAEAKAAETPADTEPTEVPAETAPVDVPAETEPTETPSEAEAPAEPETEATPETPAAEAKTE